MLEPAGLCHLFHWALPGLLANLHLLACVFALVVMLHLFIVKQIYISSMYDLGIFIIQRAKGLEVSISRASNAKTRKTTKGGKDMYKKSGATAAMSFLEDFPATFASSDIVLGSICLGEKGVGIWYNQIILF